MKIKSTLLSIVVFAINFVSLSERIAANANEQSKADSFICNENVRKAMLKCWEKAMNGLCKTEYGFAVLGDNDSYATIFSHNYNLSRETKILVPPACAAIFHTHPNSASPEPSLLDINVAHKINIPVCTITNRGIYCYYPNRNETRKVRDYPNWQKPCD